MHACQFCESDETTCAGCYRILRDEWRELRKENARLRAELEIRLLPRPASAQIPAPRA
jgi:hypothetical protein